MIKKLFFVSAVMLSALHYGQNVIFNADFESVTEWQVIDLDGDGDNWGIMQADDETIPMPAFKGQYAISFSWFGDPLTPDNVLLSPVINLPPDGKLELSFNVASADDEYFAENYSVYVIPATADFTGTETPVFTETLDQSYYTTGKIVKVDVSSYTGQNVRVVFRHHLVTDMFAIGIDDVKVVQTPLMAVSDVSKKNLTIYPNPASDHIKITDAAQVTNVRIFDLSGRLVKETVSKEIDVRNLAKGQYIVNIHSGNEIVSRKFTKK